MVSRDFDRIKSPAPSRRGRKLFRVITLVAVLSLAIFSGWLLRNVVEFSSQEEPVEPVSRSEGASGSVSLPQPEEGTIVLYFPARGSLELRAETRTVRETGDIAEKIRTVFREYASGPETEGFAPVLSPGGGINRVYFSDKRIFVDLKSAGLSEIFRSATQEKIFLQALTMTILRNAGIGFDSVRFLVEGKEWEGNHIYFEREFSLTDFQGQGAG